MYTIRIVRMGAMTTLRPHWWRRWFAPRLPADQRQRQLIMGIPIRRYEVQLLR